MTFAIGYDVSIGMSGHCAFGCEMHDNMQKKWRTMFSLNSKKHNGWLDDATERRTFMAGLLQTASLLHFGGAHAEEIVSADEETPITVTLPLEPASGGTFCVRCTLYDDRSDDIRIYRAIVDTGSPYLVLPFTELLDSTTLFLELLGSSLTNFFSGLGFNYINKEKGLLRTSEYRPTEEIYGSVKGRIDWKLADYRFRDPQLQITSSMPSGVVGVLDYQLTTESTGGSDADAYALLGLIQNNNPNADRSRFPDSRPTFLEQQRIKVTTIDECRIKSFSVNGPAKELKLSTSTLITSDDNVMPLVDLRQYGDFVDHYAVLVHSLTLDGLTIDSKVLQKASNGSVERPIVAVFDSGLTGCLLTRDFWDFVQEVMQRTYFSDSMISSHQFQSASISVINSAENKKTVMQSGTADDPKLFYINPIDLDWFDDSKTCPYVIVLGQTFLRKGVLTIDTNKRSSTFKVP